MVITHHPAAGSLDRFLDTPEPGATHPPRLTDDELFQRLADCDREDRTLLRMVVAATVATAVLGVAGALAM